MPTTPRARAVVIGAPDPRTTKVLNEVLGELDVELVPDEENDARVDVVLACAENLQDLVELRKEIIAAHAPTLAILPFADDDLSQATLDEGAEACYALDLPTRHLRAALESMLDDARWYAHS